MRNEELMKGQSIPHDSANKHVTGLAQYTDDISEPLTPYMELLDGVKRLMQ